MNKSGNKLFKDPLTFTEIWKVKFPNGIGKSFLYESLIGIRNIHFGEVFFEGKKLNNLKSYERVE